MYDRLRTRLESGRQAGFTLIELLIVIVILGILAAIVVFAVGSARSDSVTSACKADKKTITTAAEAAKAKTGTYPADMAALKSGGYIRDVPPTTDYTITYTVATGVLTVGPTTCP